MMADFPERVQGSIAEEKKIRPVLIESANRLPSDGKVVDYFPVTASITNHLRLIAQPINKRFVLAS